jgi:hypothetical protein
MYNLEGLDLTPEHELTLRAATIYEHGPGTILHDFEALLSFVRGRDLPLTKVNRLLPRTAQRQITALMKKPIEVRVGEVPLRVGQAMTYLYDFGDWWEFEVTLEGVDPAAEARGPALLDGRGTAPEQYGRYSADEDW